MSPTARGGGGSRHPRTSSPLVDAAPLLAGPLSDDGESTRGGAAGTTQPFGRRRRARASPPRPTYALVCATLVAALRAADQNVLAPSLSAIARDFGMDDAAKDRYLGGYVAAAFFAVGAPAALAAGALADRVDRIKLLAVLVVLGEAPCVLTAFVTRYWQLLCLRTLTGVSVGGVTPLAYALIGDLFPAAHRPAASAVVQLAVGGGLALGQGVAGLAGPVLGWRAPFVIVAVPALLAAAVMLATVSDPPRGCSEAALGGVAVRAPRGGARAAAAAAVSVFAVPSAAAAILQGLPGSLPWGVLIVFLSDYLVAQQGLTVQYASSVVVAWGAGGVPGVLGGGAVGQALHNWRPGSMPLFAGVAVALATAPALVLLLAPIARFPPAALLTLAFAGGACASVPGPNTRAVLLNVTPPDRRGVALAAQTVLDDVGRSAGPFVVALAAAAWGRKLTFTIAVAGWLGCGLVFALGGLTLAADEAAMQASLARAAAGAVGTGRAVSLEGEGGGGGETPLMSEDEEEGGGVGGRRG